MKETLIISGSPHDHSRNSVSRCMWNVTIALLPAVAVALWQFGIGAAIVLATSIVGCMLVEYVVNRWMLGRSCTLANGSAFLTGLLLGMNLPSNLPWWIVLIGCVVAIGIGKMSFGGLGCNIFNPALVGRVFLLLSFPAQMTTWPLPGVNRLNYLDAVTGATTLSNLKNGAYEVATGATSAAAHEPSALENLLGQVGGSLGEVGAAALIIGFIYLLCTRVITWHIPVAIVATAGLFSWAIGADAWLEILSGGLLLGAIFMATDYVTSPMTRCGMLLYGVMIGLITIIIRQWGAYPEGMSFAILLMNGATPLINRWFKPEKFGERRRVQTA